MGASQSHQETTDHTAIPPKHGSSFQEFKRHLRNQEHKDLQNAIADSPQTDKKLRDVIGYIKGEWEDLSRFLTSHEDGNRITKAYASDLYRPVQQILHALTYQVSAHEQLRLQLEGYLKRADIHDKFSKATEESKKEYHNAVKARDKKADKLHKVEANEDSHSEEDILRAKHEVQAAQERVKSCQERLFRDEIEEAKQIDIVTRDKLRRLHDSMQKYFADLIQAIESELEAFKIMQASTETRLTAIDDLPSLADKIETGANFDTSKLHAMALEEGENADQISSAGTSPASSTGGLETDHHPEKFEGFEDVQERSKRQFENDWKTAPKDEPVYLQDTSNDTSISSENTKHGSHQQTGDGRIEETSHTKQS